MLREGSQEYYELKKQYDNAGNSPSKIGKFLSGLGNFVKDTTNWLASIFGNKNQQPIYVQTNNNQILLYATLAIMIFLMMRK